MAQGWESKSVEAQKVEGQQAEAEVAASQPKTQEKPRGNHGADAETKRKRQALELQRELILSQRTSSPHRRTALTNALADVEEKLAELGWTLHL